MSLSENTTTYTNNTTGMIGWKYDNNCKQWYQASIFSRQPKVPPWYLVKGLYLDVNVMTKRYQRLVTGHHQPCRSILSSLLVVHPLLIRVHKGVSVHMHRT
jgi:hypothetical protein